MVSGVIKCMYQNSCSTKQGQNTAERGGLRRWQQLKTASEDSGKHAKNDAARSGSAFAGACLHPCTAAHTPAGLRPGYPRPEKVSQAPVLNRVPCLA